MLMTFFSFFCNKLKLVVEESIYSEIIQEVWRGKKLLLPLQKGDE